MSEVSFNVKINLEPLVDKIRTLENAKAPKKINLWYFGHNFKWGQLFISALYQIESANGKKYHALMDNIQVSYFSDDDRISFDFGRTPRRLGNKLEKHLTSENKLIRNSVKKALSETPFLVRKYDTEEYVKDYRQLKKQLMEKYPRLEKDNFKFYDPFRKNLKESASGHFSIDYDGVLRVSPYSRNGENSLKRVTKDRVLEDLDYLITASLYSFSPELEKKGFKVNYIRQFASLKNKSILEVEFTIPSIMNEVVDLYSSMWNRYHDYNLTNKISDFNEIVSFLNRCYDSIEYLSGYGLRLKLWDNLGRRITLGRMLYFKKNPSILDLKWEDVNSNSDNLARVIEYIAEYYKETRKLPTKSECLAKI